VQKDVFVGNLSWGTNDASLMQAFEKFGTVTSARVVLDRETGRSRGFAFVGYEDDAAAERAAQEMDGYTLDGRNIRTNIAEGKKGPRVSKKR